jgi:TonB family protein
MKLLLLFSCFALVTTAFSQQYGTILVSDYDEPGVSVEGVSVYFGTELLGATNHVGSFRFPKKIKGKVTLSHPDYLSRELIVKSREKLIVDTNLIMKPQLYDSLKTVSMPALYEKCIPAGSSTIDLDSSTSAISLQAFNTYVSAMMNYPKRARDAGISGTVQLRFRIDETGAASCVEILESVAYELDKEAVRILSSMPKWTPAKRNGVAIAAVYEVGIPFVLKQP